MCTKSKGMGSFQAELPAEEGDWLWVCQWGCGCVRRAGIAWIVSIQDAPDALDLGNGFALSWEGQSPNDTIDRMDSSQLQDVAGWMKLDLPESYDNKMDRQKEEDLLEAVKNCPVV